MSAVLRLHFGTGLLALILLLLGSGLSASQAASSTASGTASGTASETAARVDHGPKSHLTKVEATLSPGLQAAGWRLMRLPGKAPAEFDLRNARTVEITSDAAVAFLYRPLSDAERATQRLTWRWLVEQAGPATDLSQRGGDDRPLALHLWFPEDGEKADFWDRLVSGAAEALDLSSEQAFDLAGSGKALSYVWGGTQDRGEKLANPYLQADGVMIVLRSGKAGLGRWYDEAIDIEADFEMAFGYKPPGPAYIVLSADSDDVAGMTRGRIADIEFGS